LCGSEFELVSEDIYMINYNIIINLLFSDGTSILNTALTELGQTKIETNGWEQIQTDILQKCLKRNIKYIHKEPKIFAINIKKNYEEDQIITFDEK
jgi:hypothetical protein